MTLTIVAVVVVIAVALALCGGAQSYAGGDLSADIRNVNNPEKIARELGRYVSV